MWEYLPCTPPGAHPHNFHGQPPALARQHHRRLLIAAHRVPLRDMLAGAAARECRCLRGQARRKRPAHVLTEHEQRACLLHSAHATSLLLLLQGGGRGVAQRAAHPCQSPVGLENLAYSVGYLTQHG